MGEVWLKNKPLYVIKQICAQSYRVRIVMAIDNYIYSKLKMKQKIFKLNVFFIQGLAPTLFAYKPDATATELTNQLGDYFRLHT